MITKNKNNNKNILWLTWKDKKHPQAGGAEIVNEELVKRLVKDGCKVKLIVGGWSGCLEQDFIDGYKINTVPFFAKFYVKEKNILQKV